MDLIENPGTPETGEVTRKYPQPSAEDVAFATEMIERMDKGDGLDDRHLRPLFPNLNIHGYLAVIEELEIQGVIRKQPVMNNRGKVGYDKYLKVNG